MRKVGWILLTAVLLPYVVTLAWSGSFAGADGIGLGWKKEYEQEFEEESSGCQIILDEHDGERVDLETYLIGLVARQISGDYALEAIKAQCIITRTYLYGKIGDRDEIQESELEQEAWDGTQLELLWGKEEFRENYEKLKQAAAETKNQILIFDQERIMPLYHAVSAGWTRSGGDAYPYLKRVENPHDLEADGYLTILEWSPETFVKCLAAEVVLEETQVKETLQLVSQDASGYVEQFQVGSHVFEGERLAELLGLPSSAFSLSMHENQIRAVCRGNGHGYGMSQYGAHRLALEGRTAEEILAYYYENVEIISWKHA